MQLNTGQRLRRHASSGMSSHGLAVLNPSDSRAVFEDKTTNSSTTRRIEVLALYIR